MLSEKQIRGLISKMENAGIIQKDGAGKYTRCVKAPDFPRLSRAARINFRAVRFQLSVYSLFD